MRHGQTPRLKTLPDHPHPPVLAVERLAHKHEDQPHPQRSEEGGDHECDCDEGDRDQQADDPSANKRADNGSRGVREVHAANVSARAWPVEPPVRGGIRCQLRTVQLENVRPSFLFAKGLAPKSFTNALMSSDSSSSGSASLVSFHATSKLLDSASCQM